MENWYNYKEIFRLTNKLLGKDNELPLPPTEDLTVLANEFNNFFMSKIRKIMQDIARNKIIDTSDDYLESAFETTERLTNFKLVTDQDILLILCAVPPKSCELDLIPTTLLKVYSDVIVPYIRDIVNTSIASGSFTKNIKQALLRPLLKKMGLDLALCNYRPVSNLTYISKTIKRVVCNQFTSYTSNSGKTELLQSACKQGH